MSYSVTEQPGNQGSGYGGGKANSLPNIVGNSLQNSAKNIQGPMGQLVDTAGKNVNNVMDAAYRGGPPQLDLSGLMPKTPQQKVAESQANGGILKLRQPPQTFNPNPTPMPNPIDPGFGGGKGIFPPGGNIGFGGGKGGPQTGLPVERGSFDPVPRQQEPQIVPMMKNFQGQQLPVERGSFDPLPINRGGGRGQLVGGPAGKPILGRRQTPQVVPMMKNFKG